MINISEKSSHSFAESDHVFLVDGSSYIFRAYHALPPLTRPRDGMPVGAVAGFCNMLWKLLRNSKDIVAGVKPTHIAVIFDHSATTFRNEIYDQYKAHRPDTPEDLRPQFSLIREAVRAFSVACIEQQGFEADDLIATYTRLAQLAGARVTIIGSDKDLMQLVTPNVMMVDTMKNKHIGIDEVKDKFGVLPEKVVDVQALAGDSVDNIPGIPGIGVKTAAQLITEYGDLETLLSKAHEIKQKKRRENLIEYADQARLSRRLVELKQDVELITPPNAMSVRDFDGKAAIAFLKDMQFSTLTKRVGEASSIDPATVRIAQETHAKMQDVAETFDNDEKGSLTPLDLTEYQQTAIPTIPFDRLVYETVTTLPRLEEWLREATATGHVAIDTETTSLDAMQADLVGVSLAIMPGKACYIPLDHKTIGDLLGGGEKPTQIPFNAALACLKPMFEDPSILKIGQNLKYDALLLSRYDIAIYPFDDTMLISYALDAGKGGHGMDVLAERWLHHETISFKQIAGTGKAQVTFDYVALDEATAYAAEDADVTLRLWMLLKPRLVAEGMMSVYEILERPMIDILVNMEQRGITIDRALLAKLSGEFAQKMAQLETDIHILAEGPFNLASPKQLGDILFTKMGLPGGKKTKTGAWSTSAQVLDELAAEGHELPKNIVAWRQLAKLKSTYSDALPGFIHPDTKRVHTSYSLASTSTGRLSSSEPNLQNIPIRTEEGRKIRQAFIAKDGCQLLSADYSQIELRVLAHIADIPQLKQAFDDGLDIHAMTASEMFATPIEGMDPMVRRRAKAINFGIIYGISAFGLANQLGIGRSEAKEYIDTYFKRFPGIQDYMGETKAFAHQHGYVETLFGRRVHYPEINTKTPNHRAFHERAAINAPIQGSAADIIRRAMIRMDSALKHANLSAKMLLQVHDELIFEVIDSEIDVTIPVVTKVMMEAPIPSLTFSVPLKVDARAAKNWDDAH